MPDSGPVPAAVSIEAFSILCRIGLWPVHAPEARFARWTGRRLPEAYANRPRHERFRVCPACYPYDLGEHTKMLLGLWWRPAAAMGDILDRGSLLYASLAVIAATLLVQSGLPNSPVNFYTPLLVLAVVYVPGVLLLVGLIGRVAGLVVAFR